MSNKNRTVLYIGITNNLRRRVYEHINSKKGFASKYNCTDLVFFEIISGPMNAIAREKQLKNWHRDWKYNLIKSENPLLLNLAGGWFE